MWAKARPPKNLPQIRAEPQCGSGGKSAPRHSLGGNNIVKTITENASDHAAKQLGEATIRLRGATIPTNRMLLVTFADLPATGAFFTKWFLEVGVGVVC